VEEEAMNPARAEARFRTMHEVFMIGIESKKHTKDGMRRIRDRTGGTETEKTEPERKRQVDM